MAETYNLKIPATLLRLSTDVVERLALIGLSRDIRRGDIQDEMDLIYPTRRRAANSMVRIVRDNDLDRFNDLLYDLRQRGISQRSEMKMMTSNLRGILTIVVF